MFYLLYFFQRHHAHRWEEVSWEDVSWEEVSTSYVEINNTLRSNAGNVSWFTEFVSIHFPAIRTFHKLLFHIYRHGFMLFYDRKFCRLRNWYLNFFRAVSVYIILDDNPIIHLFFQRGPNIIQEFIIGLFYFQLLETLNDSCIYRVRLGHFNAIMFFVVIDAYLRCDYRSNFEFVRFIWDNFELFSTKKFAITLLPSDNVPAPLNLSFALPSNTRLVYLKYYRALSDGLWKDKRNCDQCMVKHRLSLQTFCCCRQSEGTAIVLLVKDSLLPYVTYVPIYISETYVILH